jgi:hypothetical protein
MSKNETENDQKRGQDTVTRSRSYRTKKQPGDNLKVLPSRTGRGNTQNLRKHVNQSNKKIKSEYWGKDRNPEEQIFEAKEREKTDITGHDLMILAGKVLIVATIVFLLACSAKIIYPNNNTYDVFSTITDLYRSLVMIIIGFFFGAQMRNQIRRK